MDWRTLLSEAALALPKRFDKSKACSRWRSEVPAMAAEDDDDIIEAMLVTYGMTELRACTNSAGIVMLAGMELMRRISRVRRRLPDLLMERDALFEMVGGVEAWRELLETMPEPALFDD